MNTGLAERTFQHADDDPQPDQLPSRPHPNVHRRAQPPHGHARRNVPRHAEAAAQRGADGLQEHEEGEEDGHGGVEIVGLQADVLGEARRLVVG
jgi:hypothetical protein